MTSDSSATLAAASPRVLIPGLVPWNDRHLDAADGMQIRARIYEPVPDPAATLVWAHGGSWTRGSIDAWHGACAALAARGTARIVSVGYRLAPRWEHPTAVMDIASAVLWAQETYQGPTFVGGDSAGGTLAAGAALAFRDGGRPLDGQILAYPPLDPECEAASYHQAQQPFPQRMTLLEAWQDYAGSDRDLRDRLYLSPLFTETLLDLCPTSMLVGVDDPVRDDVERFAGLLSAAGVHVDCQVSPDVMHGQFLDPRTNPVHDWIQQRIHASPLS